MKHRPRWWLPTLLALLFLPACTDRGPHFSDGDIDNPTERDSPADGDLDPATDGDTQPAPDGTCVNPFPLDLGQTPLEADTTGFAHEHMGSCQTGSDSEIVYTFTLTGPVRFVFRASGFDTVLYLRADCQDAQSEIACQDDGFGFNGSRLETELPEGTYYLFVDGNRQAAGAFTLSIDALCENGQVFVASQGLCIDDPCDDNACPEEHRRICVPLGPGDWRCDCDLGYELDADQCVPDPAMAGQTCAWPAVLTPESQTIQGDTRLSVDAVSGSCASPYNSGPEHIYEITLDEPMRAGFTTTGYDSLLHLRSACEAPDSELDCQNDGIEAAGLEPRILYPGTYFLFVDSYRDGGVYHLTADFRPDPCSAAQCPQDRRCLANADWSDFECACKPGTLDIDNTCLDDPCDPNPCHESRRTRCRVTDTVAAACDCDIGFIDDPTDGCIPDPDGNRWLVMVYLNADNNLEDNGYQDLAELAEAGSTRDVHVVVLFDSYGRDDGATRRLYMLPGGWEEMAPQDEKNMGDWHTLADFGVWAVSTFPAKHHALIMWDHGDGWKHGPDNSATFKSFSRDDHSNGSKISIAQGELAQALSTITGELNKPLDLIGFDACLMGMWEVGYAASPYAQVMVAAEDVIPISGWAYHLFLPKLQNEPDSTAPRLGEWIVDTFFEATETPTTLSVLDLSALAALNEPINAFAGALMANQQRYDELDRLRDESQGCYSDEHSRDLADFSRLLHDWSEPGLAQAAQALSAQLEEQVILHNRHSSDRPGAYGMTLFFPRRASFLHPDYRAEGATWSDATLWDNFIEDFCR